MQTVNCSCPIMEIETSLRRSLVLSENIMNLGFAGIVPSCKSRFETSLGRGNRL